MNFTDHFKRARAVSTPLIAVRTPDPASAIRTLSVAAAELDQDIAKLQKDDKKQYKYEEAPVILWDVVHGIRGFNEAGKLECARMLKGKDAAQTAPPVSFLKLMEDMSDDALVYMQNAHRFWNNEVIVQALWNLRDVLKQKGATFVMLGTFGATLPAELTQDVLVLDEPLPDEKQLAAIVEDAFAAGQKKTDKETTSKAVSALVGMAAFPAEQQTALCMSQKGLNVIDLWERKRQVIEQIRGLAVSRETWTFKDLGGLENAKGFFTAFANGPERPDGIIFTDEIEKVFAGFGTDSSGTTTKSVGAILTYMEMRKVAGSLFLGPPGSGKSLLASALGNELGVPTVLADYSAMETALVGSTGENIRAALAVITAMFRKPLFIATCNRWGSLPPELRRRYWQPTFYFDLPTDEERARIWPIHLALNRIEDTQIPKAANRDCWTGAEIRNCCRNARNLKCSLADAARYVVPVSISDADGIKTLRTQASGKFINAGKPGLYQYDGTVSTPTTGRRIRTLRDTPADDILATT